MTPKERAERSAAAMWKSDEASRWFGMELIEIDEGRAHLSMKVLAQHCNGMGNCHGGVSYALADSAFAFACNSRNLLTVAQHNSITYLAPGNLGDRLHAYATEVSLAGRSGLYDVEVRNQDHVVIAQFRGGSRTVRGNLFDETT